ncbi:YceI family protein [Lacinutrix sp. C3R15]|uniref:YceI family protein n=1 Tax=Flavobacteriaceae TaxID=49546 RepID=UPI001C0832DD|nr:MULTISPECIES: YceI family protein [Flavobacteriaceae]MBU2938942.1 YceI family protein [Lacinutrix sp. C3R15]MDO6622255.1 YceI family protein [Oceanihabitans sp. 1_MG-2023]
MKITNFFTLLVVTSLLFTSCKEEKKEIETTITESATPAKTFIIKPEGTSVTWTAYKTTDKVAVGGEFTTLNFDNKKGASAEEALNGLHFSIPVSSLFTKDDTRDAKLKASFFGAMLDTELISGTINYTDNKYVASITMNGTTNNLPLEVSITDERRVTMKGKMDIKDWNALDALASLNKVCFDLHKGADGVSKTWEDVDIVVTTYLRDK